MLEHSSGILSIVIILPSLPNRYRGELAIRQSTVSCPRKQRLARRLSICLGDVRLLIDLCKFRSLVVC
jgi:hypothetical protein